MQVLDQYPVIVMPALVHALGLEEAVLLQKIHFWFSETQSGKIINGQRWIYNNYATWAYQTGMTLKQVSRAMKSLESQGAIETCTEPGSLNRTKHYRISLQWLTELRNGRLQSPKRADGAPKRADDTLLTSYESSYETNTSLAETRVSAPATAETLLNETQHLAAEERKKKVKLAYPTLEELEAQIDGWWQSWELWKNMVLPRKNKSREISHSAIITALADLLEKQNRYNLSADAMRHGFSAAMRGGEDGLGVPNTNYIINPARRYRG